MAVIRDPCCELDRLADHVREGAPTIRVMPVQALRRGDQFLVALDLPGVDRGDVDVTVDQNVVDITAQRQPLCQDGDELLFSERPHGEFRRQLVLGDALDANRLSADFDRGVLTLTVPTAAKPNIHRIKIRTADDGALAGQRESRRRRSTNRIKRCERE